MPFKSKAQRRKFAELLVKGEISPEVFEEWNRETGSTELPEYAKPKARGSKVRRKSKTGSRTKSKAKPGSKSKPKAKARRRTKRSRK